MPKFPYFCRPAESGTIFRLRLEERGAVAQLVEQRTENPCVGGSIPPHTTSDAEASAKASKIK
jgi:hypothetical protein